MVLEVRQFRLVEQHSQSVPRPLSLHCRLQPNNLLVTTDLTCQRGTRTKSDLLQPACLHIEGLIEQFHQHLQTDSTILQEDSM